MIKRCCFWVSILILWNVTSCLSRDPSKIGNQNPTISNKMLAKEDYRISVINTQGFLKLSHTANRDSILRVKVCPNIKPKNCENYYQAARIFEINWLDSGEYEVSASLCHWNHPEERLVCQPNEFTTSYNQRSMSNRFAKWIREEHRLSLATREIGRKIYRLYHRIAKEDPRCKSAERTSEPLLRNMHSPLHLAADLDLATDPRYLSLLQNPQNSGKGSLRLSEGDRNIPVRVLIWPQKRAHTLGRRILQRAGINEHVGILIGDLTDGSYEPDTKREGFFDIKESATLKEGSEYIAAPLRNKWRWDLSGVFENKGVQFIELPSISQNELVKFKKEFEESSGFFDENLYRTLEDKEKLKYKQRYQQANWNCAKRGVCTLKLLYPDQYAHRFISAIDTPEFVRRQALAHKATSELKQGKVGERKSKNRYGIKALGALTVVTAITTSFVVPTVLALAPSCSEDSRKDLYRKELRFLLENLRSIQEKRFANTY